MKTIGILFIWITAFLQKISRKAQHRKGNIQYIMLYHLLERIALLILVWYKMLSEIVIIGA